MDTTIQGDAVVHGDARAYRVIIIDQDGNEIRDVGEVLDEILDRLDAVEVQV